ncbi:hypothetical protein niasHT_034765 [Heterodera trifolii]|uniref:Uncharacterized protein n=1 Tax=Heterodera trifolii TaxID=157864 RepID=A0ABD2HYU8_9BILA
MAYANGGGGGAICPPGGEGVPIRRPPAAVLRFHRRTPPPFTQSLIFIAHPQRRFCPGLSNVRIHFVFPPPRLSSFFIHFLCPSAGAVPSRKDDERKSDGDGVSVIQQHKQNVVVVAHRLAVSAVIFLGSAAMVGAASGAGGGWDDGGTPKSEPKTPTDRTAAKGGELFSHTHSLVVVGSAAELVG